MLAMLPSHRDEEPVGHLEIISLLFSFVQLWVKALSGGIESVPF